MLVETRFLAGNGFSILRITLQPCALLETHVVRLLSHLLHLMSVLPVSDYGKRECWGQTCCCYHADMFPIVLQHPRGTELLIRYFYVCSSDSCA